LVSGTIRASRIDLGLGTLRHHQPDEPERVNDAANTVRISVLHDNQPVVSRRDAEVERIGDGGGRIDGDHRRDRRHHLAGLLLVEVEDAAQHRRLPWVEFASHSGLGDQQLEVLGGRLLLVELFRPDTEEAD
jgi:hypothetical protein